MMSFATTFVAAAGEEHIDRTHSWIWPEGYELLFGTIASVLIAALLWWKAGPFVVKALRGRTERIQAEIDGAAAELAAAEAESVEIRRALGDIGTERVRLLAEADAHAAALLTDGRARLEDEIAELHTKADADIAAVQSRGTDEMRFEIAHLASTAGERIVEQTIDAATQQRLVEDFIARVGAGAAP
jgi:F-type H+-transporting ATPase subunit b